MAVEPRFSGVEPVDRVIQPACVSSWWWQWLLDGEEISPCDATVIRCHDYFRVVVVLEGFFPFVMTVMPLM